MPEPVGVNHGDHRIQPGQLRQIDIQLRIGVGEGLGYRHRLTDAGGFNQNIIEPAFGGQSAHFTQQIVTQGAADATVGHLHQLFFRTG
ncbi:hypothetical protein D3C73_1023240 [compost metagenome]